MPPARPAEGLRLTRPSVAALVEDFLADLTARAYSPRTLEGYRGTLRHLVDFLAQRKVHQIQDVTSQVLAEYQNRLVSVGGIDGRQLTPGSRAFRIGHVRCFFLFLVRRGIILTNPAHDMALPRCPRRPPTGILDLAAMKRLLLAPDISTPLGLRDRAIVELFYSTGVRVSELVGLDVFDIDLAGGELRVKRGKGGGSRQVPVGPAAVVWVGRYIKEARSRVVGHESQTALFLSQEGHRMSRRTISTMVATLAKRAQIKQRVTPHALRHAFATHMLRGRASLRHLQEMLGHKRLTTTQVYTRLDITDLKRVHRRCHPRGRA